MYHKNIYQQINIVYKFNDIKNIFNISTFCNYICLKYILTNLILFYVFFN